MCVLRRQINCSFQSDAPRPIIVSYAEGPDLPTKTLGKALFLSVTKRVLALGGFLGLQMSPFLASSMFPSIKSIEEDHQSHVQDQQTKYNQRRKN